MIKILIADDEFYIRDGIIQSVPWDDLSLEIAGEASDGQTAMEIYEKTSPEILLLDINMPGLSGLEIAQIVRASNPNAQIIFLTGYDDFEKAKQAISLQASDYLLKPVSYGELWQALHKAVNRILEIEHQNRFVHELKHKLNKFTPVASELIFYEWLQNQRSAEEANGLLRELGVTINPGSSFTLFAIEIDDYSRFAVQVTERDRQLYQYAFKKLAQEVMDQAGRTSYVLHVSPNRLILISEMNDPATEEMMVLLAIKEAERLKEAYRTYLKRSVSIGISPICQQALGLPNAFQEAVSSVEKSASVGGNAIIPYRMVEVIAMQAKTMTAKELFLLSEIRCGNGTNVVSLFHEWREVLNDLSLTDAKVVAKQILQFLVGAMKGSDNVSDIADRMRPFDHIAECISLQEVQKHVSEFLSEAGNAIHASRSRPVLKAMEKAKDWIRAHVSEEITLAQLAEYLHMNPNYVSSLFKQSTGESFIEFLTRMRFERAKEMLVSSELKIHHIASTAGFADANYFSIAFKKHHGMSPTEYRQRYQ